MKRMFTFGKGLACAFVVLFLALPALPQEQTEQGIADDLRLYYFPVSELDSPVVYEYESDDERYYWKLEREQENGRTFLLISEYDINGALRQQFREELSAASLSVNRYTMNLYASHNTRQQVECSIESNTLLYWTNAADNLALLSMKWPDPSGRFDEIQFRKERGSAVFSMEQFRGRKLRCAVFSERHEYFFLKDGSGYPTGFNAEVFYAEGVGMLKMRMIFPDGSVKYKRLVGIHSLQEYLALSQP